MYRLRAHSNKIESMCLMMQTRAKAMFDE